MQAGQRVLLHFGAVDQMAQVYINGTAIGSHTGGYTAFTLDLSRLIEHASGWHDQVGPAMEHGLSAAVYTQLSDVEDEVNGLWTYDRKVQKLPTAAIRNINLQLTGNNQRR